MPDFAATLMTLCLAADGPIGPRQLWRGWGFAPAVVLPLLVALGFYLRGYAAAGRDRVSQTQLAAFLAGWGVLALALVSPLCRLSAALASAHMAQHMLLIAVAPVLLAHGRAWAVMRGLRGAAAARRHMPDMTTITIVYGIAIWLWHLPPVYELVLTRPAAHLIVYGGLIVISTMFWHAVLGAWRQRPGAVLAALFATMIHTGLLGALLTFASILLYPVHGVGPYLWGMEALDDQQLAGLIMWVPGNLVYLTAMLALCVAWMGRREGRPTGA